MGQEVTRVRKCRMHVGVLHCNAEFQQTAWSVSGDYDDAAKNPDGVSWLPEFCAPHERVALRNNKPAASTPSHLPVENQE